DYLSTLKTNLLNEDNTLTFKIAHIDTEWTELIATTNTQGRLINGSPNPCNQSSSSNTGRFLHIEQAYDGLRNSESNWNKLSNAIAATFSSDPLPVELINFYAAIFYNSVRLEWSTATEINNYGFAIERAVETQHAVSLQWQKIGFVNGHGNSNSPKFYSFVDNSNLSGSYLYRLKQIDFDGEFEYSETVGISLIKLQKEFELEQNYPNPFNPVTNIKFTINDVGTQHAAFLQIHDILGNEILTLVKEIKQPGIHEVEFNGEHLPSGIYYYTLSAGKFRETKKMMLLK
ncbi:MAG: T9SS type A sorting domain-containing protein, partial [Melioribacteraceae bacterium]